MFLSIVLLCLAAELLDLYMGKLEEQLDRTEDTFRHMSSLLLLLQQFPGDMEPLFQQDVVTFFSNQLPVINQLRLSAELLSCMSLMHASSPTVFAAKQHVPAALMESKALVGRGEYHLNCCSFATVLSAVK